MKNPHGGQAGTSRRSFCAGALAGLGLAACGREEASGEISGGAESAALFAEIPEAGPSLGDAHAPVMLLELSDLRCSHCRDFGLHALPVIIAREVRPGRARLVFRNLPILGPASERAAKMAVAAGLQDRLWPFVDLFYRNYGEASRDVPDAWLRRLASAVPGLDVERAWAERESPAVRAELVEADRLASVHNVKGTPAFLIGRTGEPPRVLEFSRARDAEGFVKAIDEAFEGGRAG